MVAVNRGRLAWRTPLILMFLLLYGCSAAGVSSDAGGAFDGPSSRDVTPPSCASRLLKDDVVNARELGGHPLSGGQHVACRKLIRGGDLSRLSEGGCAELAQLGIKTVVDLRQDAVQQREPPPACVSGRVVSAALPKLLPDTPENYLALMKHQDAVAAVFSALGDAGSYPVYIHCVIGRDRASFVTALALLALGASRQTVIDEFQLSAAAGVAVKQPCIEAVLDEVEKQGGIETYLTSSGVEASQLDTLRAEATTN